MRTRSGLVVVVLAALCGFAGQAVAASRHTVASGDTLTHIAARLGVSVKDLAAANHISDPNRIIAGRELVIPARSSGSGASGSGSPGSTTSGPNKTGYVVRKGDTLIGVAARLGFPVAELAAVNNIAKPSRLVVGQILAVPGGWRCPVGGTVTFVNDFSYVKPGATTAHGGIDLFSPKGTPLIAPVSGRASRYPNPKGGKAVQLLGDDGTRYYFAHLDRYGASGRITAGTIVGYMGNTGNAHATSAHLHFESHPGGGAGVNPYKLLKDACR